jgi:hypothetical protein
MRTGKKANGASAHAPAKIKPPAAVFTQK